MPEPELEAESAEKQALRAYNAAVRLLASRDHSIAELTRKLLKREHSADAIQSAIDQLTVSNYVNDARYAQLYTEQRIDRGYGPRYIRAKLRERGLEVILIDAALAQPSIEWAECAQTILEKRFDADAITSLEKRLTARIARFLEARGFSSGDAIKALKRSREQIGSQSNKTV